MSNIYDLEKRTIKFSEDIICFCSLVKKDIISHPLISQLIRSATSIGANYAEANCASSIKDFRNKIYICKKESQETKYWLCLLLKAKNNHNDKCSVLLQEAHELTLIFQKITSKLN